MARSMREFREELLDKHQDHKIRNLIVRDIMSSPLVSGDTGADTVVIVQLAADTLDQCSAGGRKRPDCRGRDPMVLDYAL